MQSRSANHSGVWLFYDSVLTSVLI